MQINWFFFALNKPCRKDWVWSTVTFLWKAAALSTRPLTEAWKYRFRTTIRARSTHLHSIRHQPSERIMWDRRFGTPAASEAAVETKTCISPRCSSWSQPVLCYSICLILWRGVATPCFASTMRSRSRENRRRFYFTCIISSSWPRFSTCSTMRSRAFCILPPERSIATISTRSCILGRVDVADQSRSQFCIANV